MNPHSGSYKRQSSRHHRTDNKKQRSGDERTRKVRPDETGQAEEYITVTYGLLIYDSFAMAKKAAEHIADQCKTYDQLNVVIKEEGNMDDQELLSISPKIKVYAGAAWSLIHERRKEEGWYNTPQKVPANKFS